jgi:integrase
VRFHDLRHTYVSLLIRAGANVKEVSTWAGHSSVAFTLDRYGHVYNVATTASPSASTPFSPALRPRAATQLLALRH